MLSLLLFSKNVVPIVFVSFRYRFLTLTHAVFFGVSSGLVSIFAEDSVLASTTLFAVTGFVGEVSLALSIGIVFLVGTFWL